MPHSTHTEYDQRPPTLDRIRQVAEQIKTHIVQTPLVHYHGSQLVRDSSTQLWMKLELMQVTGSFKARGALNSLQQLSSEQRAHGVTAFSAGNHAIATAFAAQLHDVSAKVVMPRNANSARVKRCRDYGAEVVFGNDINELMSIVEALQIQEGRSLIHPFEGIATTEGTATLGLELCQQGVKFDAVIVPVGGGGLISGVATAVKALYPDCLVYGVEPEGACGMHDSLARGAALESVSVNTIADSLGAPMHKPYSFAVVQQTVDRVVTVSDSALVQAMHILYSELKLAVEPAAAASIAALRGPLSEELTGKRIGLIICGTNIDFNNYSDLMNSIAESATTV